MTPDERQASLDTIRATYAGYEATGRPSMWSQRNRGYARLARDRDARLLSLITQDLESGAHVLDLGCGEGALAGLVHQTRPDITWTGVDLRAEALSKAAASQPWAKWIQASADRLPLPARRFDVIVTETLFSSLPTPAFEQAVAAEIARVIAPRGRLVWYDLRFGNPANAAVHGVDHSRLRKLFPDWRREIGSMTVLPPLARRLGPLTPLLYPLLESLRPLRSHHVGVLRPPPTADTSRRG